MILLNDISPSHPHIFGIPPSPFLSSQSLGFPSLFRCLTLFPPFSYLTNQGWVPNLAMVLLDLPRLMFLRLSIFAFWET